VNYHNHNTNLLLLLLNGAGLYRRCLTATASASGVASALAGVLLVLAVSAAAAGQVVDRTVEVGGDRAADILDTAEALIHNATRASEKSLPRVANRTHNVVQGRIQATKKTELALAAVVLCHF